MFSARIEAIRRDRKQSHQLRVKIGEEAFGGLKGKKAEIRCLGCKGKGQGTR